MDLLEELEKYANRYEHQFMTPVKTETLKIFLSEVRKLREENDKLQEDVKKLQNKITKLQNTESDLKCRIDDLLR